MNHKAKRLLIGQLFIVLVGFLLLQTSIVKADNEDVMDKAGVLDEQTERYIYDLNHNDLSKVPGKPQLAFITVKTTGDENIADYAQRQFEKYKFGQAGWNNGVLFVIATKDHKIRMQTGYGLEAVLPDAYISDLNTEEVKSDFRKNDYSSGVRKIAKKATDRIVEKEAKILTPAEIKEKKQQEQAAKRQKILLLITLIAVVILVFLLVNAVRRLKRNLQAKKIADKLNADPWIAENKINDFTYDFVLDNPIHKNESWKSYVLRAIDTRCLNKVYQPRQAQKLLQEITSGSKPSQIVKDDNGVTYVKNRINLIHQLGEQLAQVQNDIQKIVRESPVYVDQIVENTITTSKHAQDIFAGRDYYGKDSDQIVDTVNNRLSRLASDIDFKKQFINLSTGVASLATIQQVYLKNAQEIASQVVNDENNYYDLKELAKHSKKVNFYENQDEIEKFLYNLKSSNTKKYNKILHEENIDSRKASNLLASLILAQVINNSINEAYYHDHDDHHDDFFGGGFGGGFDSGNDSFDGGDFGGFGGDSGGGGGTDSW